MSTISVRTVSLAWLVPVLAGLLTVGGCGGAPSTQDAAGQTITVYSGQHEQTAQMLVAGFTAATGIKVALRLGDEAELANQLLQEEGPPPRRMCSTQKSTCTGSAAREEPAVTGRRRHAGCGARGLRLAARAGGLGCRRAARRWCSTPPRSAMRSSTEACWTWPARRGRTGLATPRPRPNSNRY